MGFLGASWSVPIIAKKIVLPLAASITVVIATFTASELTTMITASAAFVTASFAGIGNLIVLLRTASAASKLEAMQHQIDHLTQLLAASKEK